MGRLMASCQALVYTVTAGLKTGKREIYPLNNPFAGLGIRAIVRNIRSRRLLQGR
jgi:hypothetical protein